MSWIWDVSQLLLAAGLGFGGGQAAMKLDRRRARADAEAAREANWDLVWISEAVWQLTNTGTATATDVTLETTDAYLLEYEPTSLKVGESARILLDDEVRGDPQLAISWTSHLGKLEGPARRAITRR